MTSDQLMQYVLTFRLQMYAAWINDQLTIDFLREHQLHLIREPGFDLGKAWGCYDMLYGSAPIFAHRYHAITGEFLPKEAA